MSFVAFVAVGCVLAALPPLGMRLLRSRGGRPPSGPGSVSDLRWRRDPDGNPFG